MPAVRFRLRCGGEGFAPIFEEEEEKEEKGNG